MKEIIDAISSFAAAHPYWCGVIVFFVLWFVEDRMPENTTQYKILSKILKKFGSLLTAEVREEQEKIKKTIEENHIESMKLIEQTQEQVEEVDRNRREDSQATMRDRITQIYHYYQNKGYILEKDKENYNSLYERYTKNNGNSYIKDDVHPYISSLPRFMSHTDAKVFYKKFGHYNNGTENK